MKPTRITWLASLLLSGALILPATNGSAKAAHKTSHKLTAKDAKHAAKADTTKAAAKLVPLPRPKPDGSATLNKPAARYKVSSAAPEVPDAVSDNGGAGTNRLAVAPVFAPSAPLSSLDLSTVKRALDL